MEFLSEVNDTIPEIFGDIIKTYDFKVERISSTATLLYKEDYALYLASDRDYVDILFLKKEENRIMNYWLQPFLMENLTDEDKSNTKKEDDLVTKLINYILIYEKVLRTKRKNILLGKMDWVEEYNQKTSMRSIRELYPSQYEKFRKVFYI